MSYVFVAQGLDVKDDIKSLPSEIVRAARQAVNFATRATRTEAARRMRMQAAFSQSYLVSEDGRLEIPYPASGDNLKSSIRAKFRPTSLARFSQGTPKKAPGVIVQVKPGAARFMRRAFLMKLKRGNGLTETRQNLGLAVRVRPGESIPNKKKMVPIGQGLYLLYGPSVDQVFGSVAPEVAPSAAVLLETEFNRLLELP